MTVPSNDLTKALAAWRSFHNHAILEIVRLLPAGEGAWSPEFSAALQRSNDALDALADTQED